MSYTTTSNKNFVYPPLPSLELAAYAVWFGTVVATAGYAFKTQISPESMLKLDATSLTEGFFGFEMDNTFADWSVYMSVLGPMLVLLALHLSISLLTMRYCNPQVHHTVAALFTLLLSCQLFSTRCTAMFLCLHLACLASAALLGPLAVWLCIGVAFWQFSGSAYGSNQQLRSRLELDSRGAHLYYPVTGYLYCRFLSMGLCLAGSSTFQADANRLRRLLRYLPASLHYSFYLPNFLGAPVVTMDEFMRQKVRQFESADSRSVSRSESIRHAASRLCRLCLWLLVTLAVMHCFHAGAYLETLGIRMIRHGDPVDFGHLAFAMYTRGQLFQLEYLHYYGWPAVFASLEGLRLPDWPACICRVTSYREMWRLFDRGLFAIVRDHVYIPLGGNRSGLGWQLLATAASFGFICVYHGNYDSVQAWIVLNLALVCLELLAVKVYRAALRDVLLRRLGDAWLRRLVAAVAAANLIPPSLGIFFFFYDTNTGWLVMREILWKPLTGQTSPKSIAMLLSLFYCTVQLAFEYKRRRPSSDKD